VLRHERKKPARSIKTIRPVKKEKRGMQRTFNGSGIRLDFELKTREETPSLVSWTVIGVTRGTHVGHELFKGREECNRQPAEKGGGYRKKVRPSTKRVGFLGRAWKGIETVELGSRALLSHSTPTVSRKEGSSKKTKSLPIPSKQWKKKWAEEVVRKVVQGGDRNVGMRTVGSAELIVENWSKKQESKRNQREYEHKGNVGRR